ncbi:MAG TPA: hypothetical protein VN756_04875 [Solirubrobacterales bacterium]|nr:hypothetical protein [Solirubrobacterales bacterium]
MAALQGRLEAVVDGRAIGWVWDPERPEETLEVKVLVDGEAVAKGRADVTRPVLAEAGIGDGRYGFDVPLPERLSEEPTHTIKVVALPRGDEVTPFREFETLVRNSSGAWQGITFLTDVASGRFVPEPEDPPDPGEAALIGTRGWLFPFDEGNLTPDQLRGAPLLSQAEIEGRSGAIAARREQLKELRIPYLFAVAPLKERVYRRFLPPGVELHRERPVAQVDAALRAGDAGEVFDLLPALREARRAGRAFPRTGSGWSDLGAFFAYRELMREAGKRLVSLQAPRGLDEARFVSRAGFRGDLADKPKLILVNGRFAADVREQSWEEEIAVPDVSQLRSLRMPAPPHLEVTAERAPRLYEIGEEPQLPRAVLVGDAPCLALIAWLAEHFHRFVFLWAAEPPLEAIELEMPDLVIHVISERLLVGGP